MTMSRAKPRREWHVCGRSFPLGRMSDWATVRPGVSDLIDRAHPGWEQGKHICHDDLAALQTPVIMMSQRRQETKDRLRGENDYRVNLKAELEIRQLHEKIDHQLAHQWEKLAELRHIQIELLEERTDGNR